MKAIEQIVGDAAPHWVGDGFPVRSLFSYREAELYDPFLLLDYAGPHEFGPSEATRGVGQHPHRGFETVTIVYQGELEHRDTLNGLAMPRSGAPDEPTWTRERQQRIFP
jgi:redox-sensitive bicupin YhaK (pirin superfamily)